MSMQSLIIENCLISNNTNINFIKEPLIRQKYHAFKIFIIFAIIIWACVCVWIDRSLFSNSN